MNLFVSTQKATILNPTAGQDRKDAALGQLKALASKPSDPRSLDAIFVLRELNLDADYGCPTNGQLNGDLAAIDGELERYIAEDFSEPFSSDAHPYIAAFGAVRIGPLAEQEPSVLNRLKFLHQKTGSQRVRELSFRSIAWLSEFGENSRATKPAKTYLKKFDREKQVEMSGGIANLPECLLLDHTRSVSNPLEQQSDSWVVESARRVRLYPRSLAARVLHPDFHKVPVPEPGEAKAGKDCQSVWELTMLFGCPEKEMAVAS